MLVAVFVAISLPRSAESQESPPPPQENGTSVAEVSRLLAGVEARLRMGADEGGGLALERLRLLYFLSVADEGFIPIAGEQIEALGGQGSDDPDLTFVLQAFGAALEVVRGKHAFWPHHKVGHVRTGLSRLDAVIEDRPQLVEARYLRLLSAFYLPFFFGRGDTVEADMAALADLLLERPPRMSAEAYRAVTDFVIDHGELDADQRTRLAEASGQAQSDTPSDDLPTEGR